MPWSKEIQEHMRNKIVDMYHSRKGYKDISKNVGLQWTTVKAIIHKWRKLGTVMNRPRSGQPYPKSAMSTHPVIKEPILKNCCSHLPQLRSVFMRKRLGIHGGVPRQKTLLTKENTKACLTFDKKISWLSPRLLGKYSVDWWDLRLMRLMMGWTFWKVRVPLHLV